MEHVPGRSINLAMSVRGRTGLRAAGVETQIVERHGIAMRGRMIHAPDGTSRSMPYNREGKCIYSVGRRFVNEVLLSRAEEFPNVTLHFNHKLESCDLERGGMTFTKTVTGEKVTAEADLMIGCDGAFSNVRKHMLKRPHFNYKQEYIPHGYMELCIPATPDGEFAMPPNYLHIWPRGHYMMIALPNQDKSWTVTLFMPFNIFHTLTTPEILIDFFQCSPYHVGSKSLILGDAAHAMVPFYGQGMNCGMEDCVVLDEMLDLCGDDLAMALPAYSSKRNKDAEAIVDLAMYNYVEMRDLVNSPLFLLRKKLDDFLSVILPGRWQPLYSMVTFSRRPYSSCIADKAWQDKVIGQACRVMGVACGAVMAVAGMQAGLKLRVHGDDELGTSAHQVEIE
ncbi:Kynurenine 3-monooxygenase [Chionoecetes opilio]|uniref:Kynurenine 3-monooxygenase n=1 Tax=Chionoecetes opilio TaxID=41210 RepID=A0A8J4YFJ7_CHIOP|nr:Kynurenine 3-monooxygenase [Chionoecetes opilio]